MQKAITKTFSTVMASALTTVGGFLALFFMKFKIGADLGMVLAKGVGLSMFTVLFLQPCLMLWTSKIHNKTKHKIFLPKFKGVGSYAVTHRKTIVVLALLLIIPSIIMQQLVQLSYVKFVAEPKNPPEIEQIVKKMGNSIIVIVPADDIQKNKEFLEEIKKVNNVQATMGIYGMLPKEFHNLVGDFAALTGTPIGSFDIGAMLPAEASMLTGFVNKGKTMYSILLNCPEECDEAVAAINAINKLCSEKFAKIDKVTNTPINAVINKDYYVTGSAQAVEDLKAITPTDFMVVNIASILIILLVLIFTLRSVKLPILLIAVIELGIYINLSISYMLGQSLNFMAYIIISSVQLGATVDYAILYTVKYKTNLENMPSKEAAYRALMESGSSILTSVALMGGCTLSVSLVTSNRIVAEITLMIARGSVISGALVLLVLPALLVIFTGSKKLKITSKTLEKLATSNYIPIEKEA
ncbi:MAG: MMPL family transporter, partial [Clostridia bacterium]